MMDVVLSQPKSGPLPGKSTRGGRWFEDVQFRVIEGDGCSWGATILDFLCCEPFAIGFWRITVVQQHNRKPDKDKQPGYRRPGRIRAIERV